VEHYQHVRAPCQKVDDEKGPGTGGPSRLEPMTDVFDATARIRGMLKQRVVSSDNRRYLCTAIVEMTTATQTRTAAWFTMNNSASPAPGFVTKLYNAPFDSPPRLYWITNAPET